MNSSMNVNRSPLDVSQVRYNTARWNLLLIVVFTAVNVLLGVFGGSFYMLFSASIPYIIAIIGSAASTEMDNSAILVISLFIALLITSLYLLCWIFSKKRSGWLTVAIVLFALDSAYLLFDIIMAPELFVDYLLDILFHAWVLYYLILGVKSGAEVKKLKAEAAAEAICREGCECEECRGMVVEAAQYPEALTSSESPQISETAESGESEAK